MRWERVQALFHAACDLPETEQEGFVIARAGDDAVLRDAVLGMLQGDRQPSVLDRDLAELAERVLEPGPGEAPPPSGRFGPYRLERLIGEGGMGVVYRARRDDLGSIAAIKILRDASLSPARRERFAAEQRTLAQLNHPGIARLYDADTLPDGTPWIAMELVDGLSLTTWCEQRQATIAERLGRFRAACEAVQHAHQQLVVHRDLKPSNILVTHEGAIKLLDFGIAKHLERLDAAPDQTRTAVRMATPAYAAPEQLRGEPAGVASDVYSLGVVLYELLTGRLPYEVAGRTPGEVEASVLHDEPPRPSTAGRTEHQDRGLGRTAWADLDVLCLTAMRKDAARRYPTVAALLRDVDHYLAGEPLEAQPDRLGYRLGKFARRNRVPLSAAALAASVLIGLVTFYTFRLRNTRNTALAAAARAERIQRFTMNLFEGGDREAGPADSMRVVTLVDRGLREAGALSVEPAVQAEVAGTLGSIYQKLGNFTRADSLLGDALAKRRALFGEGSPEVTSSLVALGLLRTAQARYEEAEQLVREALERGHRALPPDHPALAEATSALAAVLQERGKYDDAIAAGRDAVQRYQTLAGEQRTRSGASPRYDNPTSELAAALARLSSAHFYAGHYDTADSLNRQALAMYRELYGPTHPLVAQTLINLGAAQQERGNYADAERLHREGLALIRGYYGEDHHETAYALTMVARALVFLENFVEADGMLRRALVIKERVYGPDHPSVASTVNELGNVAVTTGRLADAERYFSRMIGIYRKTYGQKHYLLGIAQSNLASVYMRREEWARAERLFREVVALFRETQGPEHVNTAIARIKLGRTLLRQRGFAEAAAESLAGYEILSKQANPAVSFLKAARTDLAAAYDSLRQPEKAAKFKAELAEAK